MEPQENLTNLPCKTCKLKHLNEKHTPETYGSYPNHFIHGLLAEHCSSETGYEAGNCGILNGQSVILTESNPVYKTFLSDGNGLNVNEDLSNWIVCTVVESKETGYLGIIYRNPQLKQLVLAHRSTNFKLSLTTVNLVKQSPAGHNVKGVLLGNITLIQAWGYSATQTAVELVQTAFKDHSLSFTGHSLGAWLASLSVLYCHDDFKYECVQAITFDGPGAREMMEHLRRGCNRLSEKSSLEELDIIYYLSVPNIVNCVNTHVGTGYTVFPPNLEESLNDRLTGQHQVVKYFGEQILRNIPNVALATFGHLFEHMLPQFDRTGKPKTLYKIIDSWPRIKYAHFGNAPESGYGIPGVLVSILSSFAPNEMSRVAVESIGSKILTWESTTIDDIVHLGLLLYRGEISTRELQRVHQDLNRSDFSEKQDLGTIGQFRLRAQSQYKIDPLDPSKSRFNGSKIDHCLKYLATGCASNPGLIVGTKLLDLSQKFEYHRGNKSYFKIVSTHTNTYTVEDIRNTMSTMLRNICHLEAFLINLNLPRIIQSSGDEIDSTQLISPSDDVLQILFEMWKSYKIIIIKGMSGTGKSVLVSTFAQKIQQDFTPIILQARTESELKRAVEKCVIASIPYNNSIGHVEKLRDHLNRTKQQVLFIIDNVHDVTFIFNFIRMFDSLEHVRFIITTQNDRLVCCSGFPQMNTGYIPHSVKTEVANIIIDLLRQITFKHLFKMLTFLKSCIVFERDILNRLKWLNLSQQDSELAIAKLYSFSFITVNASGQIKINPAVQRLIFSYISSVVECFNYASLLRPNEVCIDLLYSKLQTSNLTTQLEPVKALQSILQIERKCNLANILTLLLHKAQTTKDEGDVMFMITFLTKLRKSFMKESDKNLQTLVTDLKNSWAQIGDDDLGQIQFVLTAESKILCTVETLCTFGKRLSEECLFKEQSDSVTNNILVLGLTDAGKTTVINHLSGFQLNCTNVGDDCSPTEIIPIVPTERNETPAGVIGNRLLSSETNRIRPYVNPENENTTYWDCPGFLASEGSIKRIEHAFFMKAFSETLPGLKILLVCKNAFLTEGKGDGFKRLLKTFNELCSSSDLEKSLSLLVTKCSPLGEDEKLDKKRMKFGKLFSQYKIACEQELYIGMLDLLSSNEMQERISFFPIVKEEGIINSNENFLGLHSALEATVCSKIKFGLNADGDTKSEISTIRSILNTYALHIVKKDISLKTQKIGQMVSNDDFKKKCLSKVKKFNFLNITSVQDFLTKFSILAEDYENYYILTQIVQALKFFQLINSEFAPDISRWVQEFERFDAEFSLLAGEANLGDISPDGEIEINAIILCTSEIQKWFNEKRNDSKIKEIKCFSYLFLVDQDLELPGIHLYIASEFWRVTGDFTLKLKGCITKQIKDSGNFFGVVNNIRFVNGGKISINLDGLKGKDGEFDLSKAKVKMNELRGNLKLLNERCNKIRILELNDSGGLRKRLNDLVLLEIPSSNDKIRVMQRRLDSCENDELIEEYNKQLANEDKKLKELNSNLKFVKDLIESIAKRKLEKNQKKYTLTVPSVNEEFVRPNSEVTIDLIRKDLGEITKQFREIKNQIVNPLVKYEEMKNLLERITKFTSDLDVQDSNEEDGKPVIPSGITVNVRNVDVDLSGSDLDMGMKEAYDSYKKAQKLLKSEFEELEKHINQVEKGLKEFNDKHGERKLLEDEKRVNLDDLKKANDSCQQFQKNSILKQNIHKLTECLESKQTAALRLRKVTGAKDITLPESQIKFRTPSKRELLKDIDYSQFVKDCSNSQKKIEVVDEKDFQNTCQIIQTSTELRAHLSILDIYHDILRSVPDFKLEIPNELDILGLDRNDLKSKLEETREKLANLWAKDCWVLGNYRSRREVHDKLESYAYIQCVKKENSIKRFDYAKTFRTGLTGEYDNYKKAEEAYEHTKKEYESYKMSYDATVELTGDRIEEFDNFFKAYDNLLECEKKCKSAFDKEIKIAQKLLGRESNLVERLQRPWKDRGAGGKCLHMVKELVFFTSEFFETYRLVGTRGTKGGNSGIELIKGNEEIMASFRVSNEPGKGGAHATGLEGTYLNEYGYPFLQGIKEIRGNGTVINPTNLTSVVSSVKLVTSFVDDIGIQVTTGTAAKTGLGAGTIVSGALLGVSILGSFVVPYIGNKWVGGPYRIDPEPADSGKKTELDENMRAKFNEFESSFMSYLGGISENIKSIISVRPVLTGEIN